MSKILQREKDNTKIAKNSMPTWSLSFAPHKLSGYNVCPHATEGCINSCVGKGGLAVVYPQILQRRIEKTRFFFERRQEFLAQLKAELFAADKYCAKRGIVGRVRLNTFSDVRWDVIPALELASFSNLRFYDYTKSVDSALASLNSPHYFRVYSLNEKSTVVDTLEVLRSGGNVAVVFDVEYNPAHNKFGALPETYMGYSVIDGDVTDDRYSDPRGVIVGLRLKGTKAMRQVARQESFAVLTVNGK